MRASELRNRLKELIPSATEAALAAWEGYAEEYADGGIEATEQARDEFYVQFLLVKRQYGDTVAATLFALPDEIGKIMNPFELPDAAKMLSDGKSLYEVHETIESKGANYTSEQDAAFKEGLRELHGEMERGKSRKGKLER